MKVLVYVEHNNSDVSDDTAKVITAALAISTDVDLLVAGYQCQNVVEQVSDFKGIGKVLVADKNVYQFQQAENISKLVMRLSNDYSHILSAALTTAKNFMPRLAALLDVTQVSDVISIGSPDTYTRPIYAGNALATLKVLDDKKVVTIRATAFKATDKGGAAEVTEVTTTIDNEQANVQSEQQAVSERPALTSAKVIISGGRGMQNGENFSLLESVADKLNGAIGASRAAVDAGYVSNELQVGQTGKIVAPELYIAVGLSGAIQHLAGMKESKVIVSINKDPDAPIHQIADYSLVADLFDVLPELAAKL